ncbi:MAG: cation diffusion facilitator family transporter, partial [Desulfobacterota bacterium]|nr:cation diffusion facilitator family transporter [Thermodesulfobacteriota bacterium]
MNAEKQKTLVAIISVLSNSLLTILKLFIGIIIGSVSIISEAIHSSIDLLAAIVALVAIKKSNQPADQEHAYGHGKFESLSGGFEALLIFVAAAWIIFEAIKKLLNPQPVETIGWGIGVMFISSVVNFFISHLLFRVSNKTDSFALLADAWHLRTDVYTSIGVMIGLSALWGGEHFFPQVDWHWIDPSIALIVALLIIKAAYNLSHQAVYSLLDARLPLEEEAWVKEKIQQMYPQIRSFHNFRSRKAGSTRFVEFHIMLEPTMSVQQSHEINDRLVKAIKTRFKDSKVMVHIEPCDNTCEIKCKESCWIKKKGSSNA